VIGEEVAGYEHDNNHLKLNFKSGAMLTVTLHWGSGSVPDPKLSIEVVGPKSPADDAQTTRHPMGFIDTNGT
jgi:hypothetical protein